MPLLEEKGEPEIVPLWASRRRSDLDQVGHGQPYGGPPYACYLSAYLFGLRFVYIRWHHWVEPTIYQVPVSFVVPIHLGIFVFGCLYEVLLSYDAIRYKNNILLSALCICDVCNFVFAAMHFGQMRGIIRRLYHDAHDVRVNPLVKSGEDIWPQAGPALLVIPFIVGVCSSVMWALASKLHRDFAWAIYKHIHADSDVKSRYLTYQVYLVFIKLDLYFFLGFVVQYNLIDVHFDEPEFSLTTVLIPLTPIVLALAVHCVRHETKIGMIAIIISYIAAIMYLLSRIAVLCSTGSSRAHTAGKDMMLLFAVAALAFVVLTLIWALQCMMNFDRGLKPLLLGDREKKGQVAYLNAAYGFERIPTGYAAPRSPVSPHSPSSVYLQPPRRFSLD